MNRDMLKTEPYGSVCQRPCHLLHCHLDLPVSQSRRHTSAPGCFRIVDWALRRL